MQRWVQGNDYGWRRAVNGFVRAARQAGMMVATITPSERYCERASERDGVRGAYAVEHATQKARQGQRGDGADRAQTQTAPPKVPDDFDSSRFGNPNASS